MPTADKLLFIDTNIYLDFYRMRNEAQSKFVDHLEKIKDKIIIDLSSRDGIQEESTRCHSVNDERLETARRHISPWHPI